MLLRRITEHVKDQNWFAVVLAFLIVVLGILIAFQITNWNETRRDVRDEAALNVRLLEEITALEELLEQRIVRAEKITTSTTKLVEIIRAVDSAHRFISTPFAPDRLCVNNQRNRQKIDHDRSFDTNAARQLPRHLTQ